MLVVELCATTDARAELDGYDFGSQQAGRLVSYALWPITDVTFTAHLLFRLAWAAELEQS